MGSGCGKLFHGSDLGSAGKALGTEEVLARSGENLDRVEVVVRDSGAQLGNLELECREG